MKPFKIIEVVTNGHLNGINSSASTSPTNSMISEDDLRCDERLNRSSPELWPEKVVGMREFLSKLSPLRKSNQNSAINSIIRTEWTSELTKKETDMIVSLAIADVKTIKELIKDLSDRSFELGLEESREMTRGSLLGIFTRK